MKIWLITDTHFGHEKMLEYCDRPVDFEKQILKGLEVVKVPDVLIHLGDVCIGEDERWHKELRIVPGKHWLLKGNHEHKSNTWYMEHGWDWVGETLSDTYFGKHILMAHLPLEASNYDLMIHGHFHNTLHRLLEKQWISPDEEKRNEKDLQMLSPKHKLLAIEYTNYRPVQLEKFINH